MARLEDGHIFIYKLKNLKKRLQVVIEERELVMCKSCLHFHQDNIPEDGFGFCGLLSRTYERNHYCADGVRRDDDK